VDGTTLTGRLTLPPNLDRSKKYPAILGSVYSNTVRNQWGGRTAHPTWGLDQYLVQEGYVLLNVNFRGSWGNGRALRRGIRLDYGGIDVEDLHSGVMYLESLGFVDMDRIGIWGSSYGGLLTCMSLFKKPGVYKAGVAGAPATNVWHAMTGEMRVMMAPQDQPEEYLDSSAFAHAAGLRDHLMIIHGMRDRVVLFKDSVTLVERLMRMGKDVDFVVLPDSSHGWDTEGSYQTIFAFKKLIGHFERYLGKGPR
jgi:dipeptidyl-peptidase-4